MSQACWQAASDGSYWIDVALADQELSFLIDLGMLDVSNQIGFALQPNLFDQLKQSSNFAKTFSRLWLDASGHVVTREHGSTTAQLIDPISGRRVGPTVSLYASRGSPGVPLRVSVDFFHLLTGCKVTWDLNSRIWCIDYP